ncbi:Transcription factor [Penicillium occitanis (nom. inval.)]|nr:Transcription factor [Penicillium occitanis (nom. inval.)]PCH04177.1 hypothetical protein PENOC_034920 [Penicillium occitanis (nom. inval.)]
MSDVMADMDVGGDAAASNNGQTKTKRSRVQFSCTACRYRKLKCDRTHPCDRCTRRGDAASCTYVGHGPRGRVNHAAGTNPSHIQNRIQHLENLILSFAQQKKQEDESGSGSGGSGDSNHSGGAARGSAASTSPTNNVNNSAEPSPETGAAVEQSTSVEVDPGKLLNNGTTYVDASNWQAILDDLKEVKKYIQDDDQDFDDDGFLGDDSEDEIVEVEQDANRPTLLFYGGRVQSKQELLADLPAREVVDRLIAKFLNSDDPTLAIIHFPTFHREYNQFWNDPSQVSLPWLAFLYGCMTMAVGMFRRSMETLPSPLGDPTDEINRFQRNCCYCLINSNYTTVGKYKVEALLVYATIEYTKRGNSAMSVSIILGIAIKLAMRMGYHRDAKHYDTLSTLEGEMRRRTWAILSQLDTLTSFQVGIPKQAQSWQSDTEIPRNIRDEDIDENSIELPPALPDTILTPITYLRSKNRVMNMFGRICDLAYNRQPSTYEKVLELDRGLEEAHELMAPALRMRPMNQSFADNAALIMKRYTLDILYQKARIVLHRKFLLEARYNPRLSYSRSVCVSAAKEILRHQYDLYKESEVGGRLEKNNWFFRSLQNNDFVLAAMVICLELFKNNDLVNTADAQQQQGVISPAESINERNKLIDILQKSREVWKENLKHSLEARKAFAAVTVMLKKAELDDEARKRSSQSPGNNTQTNVSIPIGRSPDDILAGESASNRGFRGVDQDVYMTNYVPSNNTSTTVPTPPISNSSNQITTASSAIQQPPIPAAATATTNIDIFPQSYPDLQLQSSLPGLDVIETMLDTPQNLDWHAWDGQMEDNNPTIWEEAYWNTADALNLPLNVNPNVNGIGNANANGVASGVLQMDDGINPPTSTAAVTTNIGRARSNGSIASGSSNTTSNEMYLLYTAPGYRG